MPEPPAPPELSWDDSDLFHVKPDGETPPDDATPADPPEPASVPPPPVTFLVSPGLLRTGGLHLLGGSPFAGKTTVASQLLREFVAPVGFLPGLEFTRLQPQEVGLVFTDRPQADNAQWLQGLTDLGVRHYSLADDPDARRPLTKKTTSTTPGVDLLAHCFDQLLGARLVLIDVYTSASLIGGDVFNLTAVHRHMILTYHLLEERGITLLGTCYGGKQKHGKSERYMRPIDRIIGAASLRGCASSILYVETPEEAQAGGAPSGCQTLTWYARACPERRWALERGPEGLFQVRHDVVLESERREPEPEPTRYGPKPKEEHELVILSILPPGKSLARHALAQAAQEFGIPKASVYRTIKRLVAEKVLELRDGDILFRPQES